MASDERRYALECTDQVGEWAAVLDVLADESTAHPYREGKLQEIAAFLREHRYMLDRLFDGEEPTPRVPNAWEAFRMAEARRMGIGNVTPARLEALEEVAKAARRLPGLTFDNAMSDLRTALARLDATEGGEG